MPRKLYPVRRPIRDTLLHGATALSDSVKVAPASERLKKHDGLSRKREETVLWMNLRGVLFLYIGILFAANPAQAASSKTITLNNSVNVAILEDDGIPTNKLVRLRSANGSFSTITFEMPTAELIINLAGGNDQLTIAGSGMIGVTASITVKGGDGNDSIVVQGLQTTGGITSNDTSGDLSLIITGGCRLAGAVKVTDGPGKASIGLIGSVVGSIQVSSPDGGGSLNTNFSTTVNGNVNIDSKGYGADTFQFNSSTIRGDVYLSSGNGPANLSALFSGFHGNVTLNAGSGQFYTFFGSCSIAKSFFQTTVEGATDTSFLYTDVGYLVQLGNGHGFDTCSIRSVEVPELSIINGSGGSSIRMASGLDFPVRLDIDTVVITNGDGSDTLTVDSTSSTDGRIGSMELRNGTGNSTTSIESPLIILGNLIVSSGTGFDNLTIHNAAVTGDMIGYFFDGGSDVRFDGATIGGLTDIFTTAETDYVRVIDSEFDGPLYVNTNEGDDIFTVTGSVFRSSFVGDAGAGFDTLLISLDNVFGGFFELSGIEQEWTL
jgi:hypothetical protein